LFLLINTYYYPISILFSQYI